jgi:hypothetical protein
MLDTDGFLKPGEFIVHFDPIPSALARDTRTLSRPPHGAPREVDGRDIGRLALGVVDEIADAVADDMGRDDGISALGVTEETNTITGAPALILRRLRRDGCYSAPLGELVSPTGRLDDDNRERFDAFRALADHDGLRAWIHRAEVGREVHYLPFAVSRQRGEASRMVYLARLLVTPFEVSQWRNSFLEVGCARPS